MTLYIIITIYIMTIYIIMNTVLILIIRYMIASSSGMYKIYLLFKHDIGISILRIRISIYE